MDRVEPGVGRVDVLSLTNRVVPDDSVRAMQLSREQREQGTQLSSWEAGQKIMALGAVRGEGLQGIMAHSVASAAHLQSALVRAITTVSTAVAALELELSTDSDMVSGSSQWLAIMQSMQSPAQLAGARAGFNQMLHKLLAGLQKLQCEPQRLVLVQRGGLSPMDAGIIEGDPLSRMVVTESFMERNYVDRAVILIQAMAHHVHGIAGLRHMPLLMAATSDAETAVDVPMRLTMLDEALDALGDRFRIDHPDWRRELYEASRELDRVPGVELTQMQLPVAQPLDTFEGFSRALDGSDEFRFLATAHSTDALTLLACRYGKTALLGLSGITPARPPMGATAQQAFRAAHDDRVRADEAVDIPQVRTAAGGQRVEDPDSELAQAHISARAVRELLPVSIHGMDCFVEHFSAEMESGAPRRLYIADARRPGDAVPTQRFAAMHGGVLTLVPVHERRAVEMTHAPQQAIAGVGSSVGWQGGVVHVPGTSRGGPPEPRPAAMAAGGAHPSRGAPSVTAGVADSVAPSRAQLQQTYVRPDSRHGCTGQQGGAARMSARVNAPAAGDNPQRDSSNLEAEVMRSVPGPVQARPAPRGR